MLIKGATDVSTRLSSDKKDCQVLNQKIKPFSCIGRPAFIPTGVKLITIG